MVRKSDLSPLLEKVRRAKPSRRTITFIVDGPLMAYRKEHHKAIGRSKFSQKYGAYKKAVVLLAQVAGLNDEDRATSRQHIPTLSVSVYWKRSPRADWKNVIGALEDALFPGDRWVMPGKIEWFYDTGEEKAVVTVEF